MLNGIKRPPSSVLRDLGLTLASCYPTPETDTGHTPTVQSIRVKLKSFNNLRTARKHFHAT